MTVFLTHNKMKLAFHTLRGGEGPNLLLLHGLGDQSPKAVPADVSGWPGSVYALDFTGHGESTMPGGGGYTAELLMGDADVALAMLGRATLLGRGLGGYVALLLAGARPESVRGAIIADGHGIAGGGDRPGPTVVRGVPERDTTPDPFALVELAADLRPAEYAEKFVALACAGSGLERPISVSAKSRPDWLKAIFLGQGVVEATLDEALRHYAANGTG
ncbi:MAG: alpha/beta hydrolase [Anaerolineaceae bacterium]